jgi:hypothetical protein
MRDPIKVKVVSEKTRLQRISEYVPIFISLLALGVAIDGAIQGRQHNKLSVRPYVRFNHLTSDNEPKIGLNVENNGLGPAISQSFQSSWTDKRSKNTDIRIGTALPNALEKCLSLINILTGFGAVTATSSSRERRFLCT